RYPLHDELFLIHAPSGEIHRLNATGRAVWTLLEAEALSGEELGELLAEHFRQPREAVTEDVCLLLAGLSDAGLITSAG
ncbi:PqqD family protein, partial [Staphylococcus aureus]|uniref:PqqD family protein n=1 Tax=Staphylococcus aureus TaxID=1280 RepID=UPI00301D6AD4